VIQLKQFSLDYGSEDSQIFRRLNLDYKKAEFSVICGPTGSGKSTLLKSLIGLVPALTYARIAGERILNGIEISGKRPQQLANLVGYVNQTPESAFVAETVVEEIAFGMEQLGFTLPEMEHRVKQISSQLGIEDLLESKIDQISAGQQQRVAIASALAAGQKILLLDEPSAALDSDSAGKLWKFLRELVDKHEITVLVAEHRLEEAIDFADSITLLKGDGSAVKVGAAWTEVLKYFPDWNQGQKLAQASTIRSQATVLRVTELDVTYQGCKQPALRRVSLTANKGEVVSLLGPNGSGKTTLLMAIAGALKKTRGSITFNEREISDLPKRCLQSALAVIPQRASDLLFLGTVSKELCEADRYASVAPNTTSSIFENLIGRIDTSIHPRDLSTGQQLALVIALQLSVGAELILLDEPTRGLDYEAKASLVDQLRMLALQGKTILIATHDDAFAKRVSDRTIGMHLGQLREARK
jgi:energy-coupling factor transport system ATP-binding protein